MLFDANYFAKMLRFLLPIKLIQKKKIMYKINISTGKTFCVPIVKWFLIVHFRWLVISQKWSAKPNTSRRNAYTIKYCNDKHLLCSGSMCITQIEKNVPLLLAVAYVYACIIFTFYELVAFIVAQCYTVLYYKAKLYKTILFCFPFNFIKIVDIWSVVVVLFILI